MSTRIPIIAVAVVVVGVAVGVALMATSEPPGTDQADSGLEATEPEVGRSSGADVGVITDPMQLDPPIAPAPVRPDQPLRPVEPRPPHEPEAPPAATDVDPARAETLLRQMREVYPRAVERPASPAGLVGVDAKAQKIRQTYLDDKRRWEDALTTLPRLAEQYFRATPEAERDPGVAFFAGFARVQHADVVPADEAGDLFVQGAADLRRYLAAAADDAPYRGAAEGALAYALLRLARGDVTSVVEAVPHADTAVRIHLADGRADEAGRLAFLTLSALIAVGEDERAAALGAGWEQADFGASAAGVATLLRRARIRPGAPMPALPALDDQTGAPMPWADAAGSPYVLHFFATTISSTTREVETILLPLAEEYRPKGLKIFGCSTDRALTPDEVERTQALWDEWGKKDTLRDGTLESVRAWAEENHIDWPWYWDGKWMNNALVRELGMPVNMPYAILVGADGVIRWRGEPYKGLSDAVAELLGSK